jgi:hypothetical protein
MALKRWHKMMSSTHVVIPACYHSPKMVIKIDGIDYWCSDRHGAIEFNGDAIINLTGVPNIPQLSHIPSLAAQVDTSCEEIVIAWPDYGVPKVKRYFWRALHDYCKQKQYQNVCFHCAGGHGRTGTALAAMVISILPLNVIAAIKLIRKKGCWRMIETPDQCEYLWNLDRENNDSGVIEADIPLSSIMIEDQMQAAAEKMQKESGSLRIDPYSEGPHSSGHGC